MSEKIPRDDLKRHRLSAGDIGIGIRGLELEQMKQDLDAAQVSPQHDGDEHSHDKLHVPLPPALEHFHGTIGDFLKSTRESLRILAEKAADFDAESALLQEQYDNRKNMSHLKRTWVEKKIRKRNRVLKDFERNFLAGEGLHQRLWCKHMVFGPGRYTG